jgi:hypothetical protein
MITIRGARLPFDKGDSVKARFTLPGLPQQIGTIIRVESFYSTVVYVVEYPDKRTHRFFSWQLEHVQLQE